MLTVLIAEDERDVATVVAFAVRMAWPGSRVHVAQTGAEALRVFGEEQPDVVILDISMPPPDGLDVCQRIRAESHVPILMLTVHNSTLDKVRALDRGADDYIVKPFDELELLARLRALLRRARTAHTASGPTLTAGDIVLDTATHEVRVQGEVVRLTSTEYRLLAVLMQHAGTVLPPDYLIGKVWGPEYRGDTQSLRVFIRRLRRKLGDDPARPRYIQTDWHAGYRFIPRSAGEGVHT